MHRHKRKVPAISGCRQFSVDSFSTSIVLPFIENMQPYSAVITTVETANTRRQARPDLWSRVAAGSGQRHAAWAASHVAAVRCEKVAATRTRRGDAARP